MEDAVKDQSSAAASGGRSSSRLLRYPLRSATKSKEEKQAATGSSNSSAPKRPASCVSKSVGVLDLSAKDKSAKPTRRLSIPAKSAASPVPKTIGNITPISEARAKRSVNYQGKSETPVSDISKSYNRRKFNVLLSASYWISQIKLSESAAKHSISIGFFKLALEAGCEPLQLMADELKSYARRHNLVELGEPVKELFHCYNISEHLEQLQVSETFSHVPEEGTRSSDDEHSSSSIVGPQELKPKSLNVDAIETSPVKEPAKEIARKSNSATKIRTSINKNSSHKKSTSGVGIRNTQKKTQKPSKKESDKEKEKVKQQGKQSAVEGPINLSSSEESLQEDKENMDGLRMEEVNPIQV